MGYYYFTFNLKSQVFQLMNMYATLQITVQLVKRIKQRDTRFNMETAQHHHEVHSKQLLYDDLDRS